MLTLQQKISLASELNNTNVRRITPWKAFPYTGLCKNIMLLLDIV